MAHNADNVPRCRCQAMLRMFVDLRSAARTEDQELQAVTQFVMWMESHRSAAIAMPPATIKQLVPTDRKMSECVAQAVACRMLQH